MTSPMTERIRTTDRSDAVKWTKPCSHCGAEPSERRHKPKCYMGLLDRYNGNPDHMPTAADRRACLKAFPHNTHAGHHGDKVNQCKQ